MTKNISFLDEVSFLLHKLGPTFIWAMITLFCQMFLPRTDSSELETGIDHWALNPKNSLSISLTTHVCTLTLSQGKSAFSRSNTIVFSSDRLYISPKLGHNIHRHWLIFSFEVNRCGLKSVHSKMTSLVGNYTLTLVNADSQENPTVSTLAWSTVCCGIFMFRPQ